MITTREMEAALRAAKRPTPDLESQTKGMLPRAAYFNSLERGWMGQSTENPTRHAEEDEFAEWLEAGLLTEEL